MNIKLGDFFPKKAINEPLLKLDDPLWATLEGGYRKINYDASVPLRKLEQAEVLTQSASIYAELWDELHHQGDVGLASYYAVPHLVRIATEKNFIEDNLLGLVTVIEIQRYKNNPPVPQALLPYYNDALINLGELAKHGTNENRDVAFVNAALAAIAVSKGLHKLADAIIMLGDESVLDEFLDTY